MQYNVTIHGCKNGNFQIKNDIFLIFAENIDRGYTFGVLKMTHNLCFGAKIRK